MAATEPTPPATPPASSARRGASVILFLDTDLGTHFAMAIAADPTIRHLKALVAAEHAVMFPELGSVTVKSLQVRRKGILYHLSDSILMQSALSVVKGMCSLYAKMAATSVCCTQGAPAVEDGGRLGKGVCVEKCVRKLPVGMSEIASHVLPQGLEGEEDNAALDNILATEAVPSNVLPSSSAQRKMKGRDNETVSLVSNAQAIANPVANKGKTHNQGKEEDHARKEELLHGDGGHDEGANVVRNREVRKNKDISEEIHIMDDLSQEKERKKAKKTGSFDTSAANPTRATDERENRDVIKSDSVPLETYSNAREKHPNTSFQQASCNNVQDRDSIQLENPIIDGKKKKRKRHQSKSSKEAVSAQEMIKPSPGAVEYFEGHMENTTAAEDGHGSREGHLELDVAPEAGDVQPAMVSEVMGKVLPDRDSQGLQGDGTDDVALTSIDTPKIMSSDVPLSSSSQLDNGNQGTKLVGLAGEAQAINDLVVDQGKMDHVLKEQTSTTIGAKVDSVSVVVASEEKSTRQNDVSLAGGKKKARKEQLLRDDRGHEEGATVSSYMEKVCTSKNISEEIHAANDTSQEKKHKKTKKVGSGNKPTVSAAREIDESGYVESMTKSDKISNTGELINDYSQQEISNNVQQGDSRVMENLSSEGKRKKKKKKRHQSEPSKEVCPANEVTKSSPEFVTKENSIQNTDAASIEPKQVTSSTLEEATTNDCKKINKSLDVATTNLIAEVLANLRSTDTIEKDLGGNLSREQTHLSSNENVSRLHKKSGAKAGVREVLPPKYPAAIHPEAPISSPSHTKSKGKQSKVLSTKLGSSCSLGGVPEENASTESKKSDALKDSNKTSVRNVLSSDIIAQTDENTRATKRKRKKSLGKHLLPDSSAAIGSSGEQGNQAARGKSEGADVTKAALVQGDSVIAGSASTVGKILQKSIKSSKTQTSTIQETIHSSKEQDKQLAKDGYNEYVVDISRTHDNENAVVTTQPSIVQRDATAAKSASPIAKKERKRSSKSELQRQDALQHGSEVDLINFKNAKEMGTSKSSADTVKPNDSVALQLDSNKTNFIIHFGPSKVDEPSVSAENTRSRQEETVKQVKEKKKSKRKLDVQSQPAVPVEPNDPVAIQLHGDKTSFLDHVGTGKVDIPSVSAENMSRENDNVKQVKEKKKRKRKLDLVKPAAEEENLHYEHQDAGIGNHDLLSSIVQEGRMSQDSRKENKDKFTQNNSMLPQEPEDTTCDNTFDKKLHGSKSDADDQNNLSTDKQGPHMSKVEQRNSTSQTRPHFNSTNHDGSIDSRTGPKHEDSSNLVKGFSMSPASSENTEDTPQVNRYRLALRNVPIKRSEQASGKSKKESKKGSTGAIFDDVISEGSDDALDTVNEKAVMETSNDYSPTSADSGISSAAFDGKDVSDDDDARPLSQKGLKEGLDIASILRGSSSYKKAKLKQAKHLDSEVPGSQQVDIVFETEPYN